ncbi:MAG: RnfABCDGE type electron transport complex subunit D [Sphaerochaetaceae bacterium]|nr:RnfABCDGE type electron transport complex subunit D [Sphaerochaetaceae bacterium]
MANNYNLITVSSPHFHNGSSGRRIMLDVIIALIPAAIAAVVIFGMKSLALMATCIIAAIAAESLFDVIVKKKNTVGDLSAIVTGLLLALNLGTEVALWEAAVGSVFAIVFVKCIFGGLGKNFANPAITGRVFMIIAFGSVTSFVNPKCVELVSSATPLANLAQGAMDQLPTVGQMLLGLHGGTIGETCIIALVLGWVYLSVRKVIKWYVPAAFIATVFVLFLVFTGSPVVAFYEILSGGLFLGAIFMATDYVSTPITVKGKVVFCICCGIITFIIRKFCALPEGVSFSILIMNILTPWVEKLTHNVPLDRRGK